MKATIIEKHGASSAVYGMGLIGAAVYFISTATGFWIGVLGFLESPCLARVFGLPGLPIFSEIENVSMD